MVVLLCIEVKTLLKKAPVRLRIYWFLMSTNLYSQSVRFTCNDFRLIARSPAQVLSSSTFDRSKRPSGGTGANRGQSTRARCRSFSSTRRIRSRSTRRGWTYSFSSAPLCCPQCQYFPCYRKPPHHSHLHPPLCWLLFHRLATNVVGTAPELMQ